MCYCEKKLRKQKSMSTYSYVYLYDSLRCIFNIILYAGEKI